MPTSPVKKMKKATPFLPKLRVFKVVLLADRISQLDLSSLPSTFQVNELIKKTILYFAGFWWTKKKMKLLWSTGTMVLIWKTCLNLIVPQLKVSWKISVPFNSPACDKLSICMQIWTRVQLSSYEKKILESFAACILESYGIQWKNKSIIRSLDEITLAQLRKDHKLK